MCTIKFIMNFYRYTLFLQYKQRISLLLLLLLLLILYIEVNICDRTKFSYKIGCSLKLKPYSILSSRLVAKT